MRDALIRQYNAFVDMNVYGTINEAYIVPKILKHPMPIGTFYMR